MSSFFKWGNDPQQCQAAMASTRQIKVTKTIQKTLPNGQVVTETTTEYRTESNDNHVLEVLEPSNEVFGLRKVSEKPFQFGNSGASNQDSKGQNQAKKIESEETPEVFQAEALRSHNEYRKKHGCPPLKLSQKLCNYAQEWANQLARQGSFEHRPDSSYGENLYCSWSSDPNAKCPADKAVDSWYSEIQKYQFGREPTSTGTGHFTQVIWKGSKEMGIAKTRSSSGKILVVANYEPAGNYIGQYVANVPAPLK